jgi:LL-diaminopimelate aminotransferase
MNGMFEPTDRLKKLPPYVFAKIDKIKQEEIKKGKKLISLGIGDPDLPTPDFILDRLNAAARKPANQKYPSYWGLPAFRQAIAQWMQRRFDVVLNPDTEIMPLIGSKEGLAHIPLAFVNPGEGALVPDPGYPVYAAATLFAGGVPMTFALREENDFLPDFAELEALVKKGPRARLLFLNYPNNPTSASASLDFFKEVVAFARKHQIIVCHDNAYSELYFDGKKQPSFLEAPGAKEVGVEFHSLSKTFNMTGWRAGFVVGHPQVIAALQQVKTNIDTGLFNAIQEAGIEALEKYEPFCSELRAIYQKRRDVLIPALQNAGLQCRSPEATFYAWARIPQGRKSEEYVLDLIRSKGIVSTPGTGFGDAGEGYVRFTLCSDISVLKQVAEILKGSI